MGQRWHGEVFIYIWKQLMLPRHVTEEKWSKIRRMYVRMWGEQTKGDAAQQCGAHQPHGWEGEREDLHVSQGRKQGSTDTLVVVVVGGLSKRRVGCVCARARPGQQASSPAVSDVTVGLCVSGVWSKSITESKKPNATNHVHNSSSVVLCLTLSLLHPGAP